MHTTNVRNLKKNPSLALRQSEGSPVLVLKGNEPNAVILHLDNSLIETGRSFRSALAATLYKNGSLSLGAAAKLSALPLTEFVRHLARLGIGTVKLDETTETGGEGSRQMARIIIADAGPLTALPGTDNLVLLRQLFSSVCLPPVVKRNAWRKPASIRAVSRLQ